jgi:hypothetical protein
MLDPSAFASWGTKPGDADPSTGEPPLPPIPVATHRLNLNVKLT